MMTLIEGYGRILKMLFKYEIITSSGQNLIQLKKAKWGDIDDDEFGFSSELVEHISYHFKNWKISIIMA